MKPATWALIIVIGLALVGCAARTDDAGPADAARRFVAALEARDASAIISLLEPSDWRGEIGPELRSSLGHLASLELRDATYSVVENDGATAQVRIAGTMVYQLAEGGAGGERPVELLVETVRVGDAWFLRSLDLPQP